MNYHTQITSFFSSQMSVHKVRGQEARPSPWVNLTKDMEHPLPRNFFVEPFPMANVHLQKAIL